MTEIKKRILLVDDQKFMVQLLSFELIEAGHDVSVAYNGVEALEALYSDNYDVLVTDLFMPEMGGTELIENLKLQQIELPTIVLSASRNGKVAEKLNDLGVSHFIDKPITDEKVSLLQHLVEIL